MFNPITTWTPSNELLDMLTHGTFILTALVSIGALIFIILHNLWKWTDDAEEGYVGFEDTFSWVVGPLFVIPISAFAIGLALFAVLTAINYLWFPLSVLAGLWMLAYVFRYARRTHKALHGHMKDPYAHSKEK